MFKEILKKKLADEKILTINIIESCGLFSVVVSMDNKPTIVFNQATAQELDDNFIKYISDDIPETSTAFIVSKIEEPIIDKKESKTRASKKEKDIPIATKEEIQQQKEEDPEWLKEQPKESIKLDDVISEEENIALSDALDNVNFEEPIDLEPEEKPYKDANGYFMGGKPIIEGLRDNKHNPFDYSANENIVEEKPKEEGYIAPAIETKSIPVEQITDIKELPEELQATNNPQQSIFENF